MTSSRPESDADLFCDATLLDPYPLYRQLRDQAAAVWMRQQQMYAVSRFDDVRESLRNWQVFSSASGVAMNEPINQAIAGNTLGSDPPLHDRFRRILVKPLLPAAMPAVTAMLDVEAERIVERLCSRGRFDAAAELAPHLPLAVVSHLVGLPEEGRERMREWAAAAFDSLGPDNARGLAAREVGIGLVHYAFQLEPAAVKPGSWAALAFDAAQRGEISLQQARGLILDYTAPSLDTTIFAIANAIWLFARHPQSWQMLRDNPALMPSAINEVLRLESPLQAFSRLVTTDTSIGDVTVPAGSRVIVLYGSANRDERKWDQPEYFDIQRKAAEQLAFGHGEHLCVGLPLARLEIKAVLSALITRVARFELLDMERAMNNTLRGIAHLDVRVH